MRNSASLSRLAVAVMCAALLVSGADVAFAGLSYTDLSFDVTVVDDVTTDSYVYDYTVSIPGDAGDDNPDICSDVDGFYIEGAYHVSDITHVNEPDNGYVWYAGEVLEYGESPSWDPSLTNTGSLPLIVWGRNPDESGDGRFAGPIGSFSFASTNGPMTRDWVALSYSKDGTLLEATGETVGPTPGLSPILLLLGQGVPILGWIGYRRRRES